MIELVRDIIKTIVLRKFDEVWVKSVASRVETLKLLTHDERRTNDERRTPDIQVSQKLTMSFAKKRKKKIMQEIQNSHRETPHRRTS